MPIVYTRLEDNGVSIIFPSPGHDGWKDVPDGAINAKEIAVEDIPQEYAEFWDAYRYDGERINICLQTAATVALDRMKVQQKALLDEVGKLAMHAQLNDDQEMLAQLKSKYAAIKDAHRPLEAFQVSGYNDPAALNKIKELSALPNIEG